MAQVAIDTPDGQRGVVSAQILLATVPADSLTTTVGIPPNTETLVVLARSPNRSQFCTAVGVTTGLYYPQLQQTVNVGAGYSVTVFIDVSSAVDGQVEIQFVDILSTPAWVYADSAVHFSPDPATAAAAATIADNTPVAGLLVAGTDGTFATAFRTNQGGVPYVIPTVPSIRTHDHPPTELNVASPILGASATVIAAPGAGMRIRVFSMQMGSQGQAFTGYLTDSATGQALMVGGQSNAGAITLPGQGYPLAANAGLNFIAWGGTGNMMIVVYYTMETV